MQNTFLIDTNILVYAYNKSSQFHHKALEIIENALNRNIVAAISDKNLFEFFVIITDGKRVEKPISVDGAIEVIDFLINSNIRIIYSSSFTLLKTFELAKYYKIAKQKLFDIVIVAIMIENKIQTILTANEKDFRNFKEIKTVNPFSLKDD